VAAAKDELNNIHLPNIIFKDSYLTKVGKESIKSYYFGAGHTNGDIIIHMQDSNVVHIGDLVFNRRFPYIDKGAGASIKNWITILEKIKTTFDIDTIFICGHAGQGYDVIVNKNDISAFQNYLSKLLELGEKCKKEGMDLETAKANIKVIPGAEEWQGDGIIRSLDALFAEMKGI
jgi:glyoxylase-like metal-dependent hydrolase (beta-lactamase superfamily II)